VKQDKRSTKLRYEIFCREYLIDFNATRAAREAGYSKKTAQMQGSRLLSKVIIQEKIKEAADERIARIELTAENVLEELRKIGFVKSTDVCKKTDGLIEFRKPNDLDDDIARAISSIKYDKDKGIEYRFHNKEKALELLGRSFGLFTDNVNLKGAFTHTHDVNMKKLRKAINAIRGKGNKRKS